MAGVPHRLESLSLLHSSAVRGEPLDPLTPSHGQGCPGRSEEVCRGATELGKRRVSRMASGVVCGRWLP
jgi:hypothetical protein